MASSATCFLQTPEIKKMAMEVREALPPLLLGRRGCFRSSLLAMEKILPPYLFHQITLHSSLKMTLNVGVPNCFLNSPLMSRKKECSGLSSNLATTSREPCKVLWTIQADIEDGQLLFITGDPLALGCWEPEMAVLMSPSAEHANWWKTEIEVPCGLNSKYNYFIKGDKGPSCDFVWRPGPDFTLSVPLHCKQNEAILVKDSWLKNPIERAPVPLWGSWIDETDIPAGSIKISQPPAPFVGEDEILNSPECDSSGRNSLLLDPEANSEFLEKDMAKNADILVSNLRQSCSLRDQPMEEPWLLDSSCMSLKAEETLVSDYSDVVSVNEAAEVQYQEKGFKGMEDVVPEESKMACTKESISTVILINSSVCTMQRIAVLEDEKLVELLLEPVKNNVQCDSVYLGVVTKLVPHMGGAFVDIGISRPSLMDIKQNREPFVYPPFRRKRKKLQVNGAEISELKEQPTTHEPNPVPHIEDKVMDDLLDEDLQDDSVSFMHEEFEEYEAGGGLDVSDALKGNLNDSLVDYGAGEADFEDYFEENGHHVEDEAVNELLPIEMESSNDSELSHNMLQDLKVPIDTHSDDDKWFHVRKGTKIIVQVVKEGLGTKGPALTAYPNLRSRFWILITRCNRIGVSKKISGVERTRLRVIAKTLQPPGFGLTVRTVAAGHSLEELQKDLDGLLSTWKDITEHAKSAALAADEGVEGAVPVILHTAMGQTLSVVQDYFNEKVKSMVVDSPRTYHEVTSYLQEIAPDLCDRVELYDKRIPIFDEYGIEEEINNILSKRVPLSNGGSLVIEQTEALVSIDVNGGHGMLGQGTSQEKAILDVNLAAAKQIARELRLRDIGGIIVVDFIDMVDDAHKRLVYEEIKKAVERDRSMVRVSELSRHGLMEITRKRVRPSVTFMISEPCTCCHATGRVQALETSFSKIEHEICRLLAISNQKADPENAKSWPRFVLRVDRYMCNYLTSGRRTKLAVLSSSLKVWILLKVARGFPRGAFEIKPFSDDKSNYDQQQVDISRLRSTNAGPYIPSSKLTLFPVKKWKSSRK